MEQRLTIEQAVELAIQHHTAGRLQQAEQIYLQVLQAAPNHPDALHLMGVIALQVGRADLAVDFITRAISVRPVVALFHSNLSEAYRHVGRLADAEAAARRSVELDPRSAPGHANLGAALSDQGKLDEAESEYRAALELEPKLAIAVSNIGNIYKKKGRLDEAIEYGRRAIEINPNDPLAHNNLGASLEMKELLAEAEGEYRQTIKLDPRRVEAYVNLGTLLYQQHRHDEAQGCWEQAAAINPQYADAHWNVALSLLARGDFERGWPMHEWRFKCTDSRLYLRDYDVPLWTGADLSGKTILLYPEQGYGDVIQFSRFVAPLAEMGAKVVLHMPPELIDLMKGVEGVSRVARPDEPLGEFDTHRLLLSIPSVLKTTLATLPNKVPYIRVDPQRQQRLAERMIAAPGTRKIGIVWAGRPTHSNDARRSMTLDALAPLKDVQGVTLFSLQKGEATKQLANAPFEIVDLQNDLHDFADTAAAIANLDLVIAVDTAVAHLTGAIAKPVWLMLPFAADYRWMHDREDSPWYPTMRIFRQNRRNDWSDVVSRIKEELQRNS